MPIAMSSFSYGKVLKPSHNHCKDCSRNPLREESRFLFSGKVHETSLLLTPDVSSNRRFTSSAIFCPITAGSTLSSISNCHVTSVTAVENCSTVGVSHNLSLVASQELSMGTPSPTIKSGS